MEKLLVQLFLLGFFILLLIAGPLITIWSLNTLFGIGISYTFKTWLATMWLSLVTVGSISRRAGRRKN